MPSRRVAGNHGRSARKARGSTGRGAAQEVVPLDTAFRMRPVSEGTIHATLRYIGPGKPRVFPDDFPAEE